MKKIIDGAKKAVIDFFSKQVDFKDEKQDPAKIKREKYLELMKALADEYGFYNTRKFPVPPPYPNPDLLVRLPLDTARELQDKFWLESIAIYKIWIQNAQLKKARVAELLEFVGSDETYEAKYFKTVLIRTQDSADYTLIQAEREIEFCERERKSLGESFDEHTSLLVKQLTQLKKQSVSTGRDFNEIIDEYFSTLDQADYSDEALALAKLIVLGRGNNEVKRLPN